jgi:hypothetical protein
MTEDTLATITACAALGTTRDDPPPVPGERPATGPLTAAHVVAEAEPFMLLATDLNAYFDGDPAAALAGADRSRAQHELARIVAGHVDAARRRLTAPAPRLDWTDRGSLLAVSAAAARRAGDLRFVEILTAAVPA